MGGCWEGPPYEYGVTWGPYWEDDARAVAEQLDEMALQMSLVNIRDPRIKVLHSASNTIEKLMREIRTRAANTGSDNG